MRVIQSSSMDPAVNFGLEAELLSERGEDFLFLYINSPCVVVGRNQQTEAEVDLDWCLRNGIPVVRRMSGGGTVWHDAGNINWAFVTTVGASHALDDRPLELVISSLRDIGVEVVTGPRSELLVGDKKISGTASCVRRGRRLFHGTLLWEADLDAMRSALAPDTSRRGGRVASIPSHVANLRSLTGSEATAAQFMETFAAALDRRLNR